MTTKRTRDLPARLEGLRPRLARWRRTPKGRTRIPKPLWAAALKLAGTYGIHRTAIWPGTRLWQVLFSFAQTGRQGCRDQITGLLVLPVEPGLDFARLLLPLLRGEKVVHCQPQSHPVTIDSGCSASVKIIPLVEEELQGGLPIGPRAEIVQPSPDFLAPPPFGWVARGKS